MRIGAALLLVAGLVTFGRWQLLRPKLSHATLREIESALPNGSWEKHVRDTDAIFRMMRLFALAKISRNSNVILLSKDEQSRGELNPIAHLVWQEQLAAFDQIDRLLKSGPLEYKSESDPEMDSLSFQSIRNLAKILALIGTSSAIEGDFATCKRAISIDITMIDRFSQANGGFKEYINLAAIVSVTELAIQQIVRLPTCPASLCREWLARLPTTSISDPLLARSIQTEFQEYTVPRLSDPTLFVRDLIRHGMGTLDFDSPFEPPEEDYVGLGTFDPIPTARLAAKLVQLEKANTLRPLSQYDPEPDRLVSEQAKGLPEERGRRGTFERIRFRYLMSNSKNSIGRALIAFVGGAAIKSSIRTSYHWRALNEATRILIATALYRRSHQARLPTELSALTPELLQSIPLDPYDGHEMRYSARDEKVWSVGEDLHDDKGDIDGRSYSNKDLGLSLRFVVKPITQGLTDTISNGGFGWGSGTTNSRRRLP